MKKPNVKILNTILALGMLLIAAGFFFILCCAGTNPGLSVSLVPGVLLLAGMVDLYIYIAFKATPFRLFLGLDLCSFGVLSFILIFFNIPVEISVLWPIYVLLTAISLFVAGRTKGKKFSINYDLSALIMAAFGILFFLFSCDVIKISFSQLTLYAFPVILICGGVCLMLLFVRRKRLLELLPEEMSKELNSGENPDDTVDDDSGVIL